MALNRRWHDLEDSARRLKRDKEKSSTPQVRAYYDEQIRSIRKKQDKLSKNH